MKCTILRWLLGIWLVETVAARHIQNGQDTGNTQSRIGRDQFHPFYQQPPHLNYNSFRSSLRRAPPQVPDRRNINEQDVNNNGQHHFNNYANSNHHPHNQQTMNVYSAVRLHGALEARAKNEPGSNTLLPTTQHVNYYHSQPQQQVSDRHRRRDDEHVDGESFERDDDLARFSLYNSYFDNEHSIKALNSMKCVTPTGSPGFCSTFRGCVPSFFTTNGELEAPALAELISTSIGYCTTNVSHHFIREQRQQHFAHSGSREERRFDSVANRIICCPGVAPARDPNEDPDKIFNDYIENQKRKTTTTSTLAPPQHENVESVPSDSPTGVSETIPDMTETAHQEAPAAVLPEENIVSDGGNTNKDEQSSVSDIKPVETEVDPPTAAISGDSSMRPSQTEHGSSSMRPESKPDTDDMLPPADQFPSEDSSTSPDQSEQSKPGNSPMDTDRFQPGDSSMSPDHMQPGDSSIDPGQSESQPGESSTIQDPSKPGSSSMSPDQSEQSQPESSSMSPDQSEQSQSGSSSINSDQSQSGDSQSGGSSVYPDQLVPEGSTMYPEHAQTESSMNTQQSGASTMYPEQAQQGVSSFPDHNNQAGSSMYPGQSQSEGPTTMQPEHNHDSSVDSDQLQHETSSINPEDTQSVPTALPHQSTESAPEKLDDSSSNSGQPPSGDTTISPEHSQTVRPDEQSGGSTMYPPQPEQGSSGTVSYPEGSNNMNSQQQIDQSSSSEPITYPDGTMNQPGLEVTTQPQSQNGENPTEASSPAEQSPSEIGSGVELTSHQPIGQEVSTAPSTSNDESDISASSTVPPGAEQTNPGKLPPKTQDSNIIKIYPEPVSGVNGKFTLPGGLYIVSTSTDTSNNNQLNPANPADNDQVAGGVSAGDETIVGSRPIIIVTNPGSMSPPEHMVPAFPGEFPSMESMEMAPPVDDSSLELQQRPRPQRPNFDNVASSLPPMQYPSSSSASPELPQTTVSSSSSAVNEEGQQPAVESTTDNFMQHPSGQPEVQITTGYPQQDEGALPATTQRVASSGDDMQSEHLGENDGLIITTIQPQKQQQMNEEVASGASTSNIPPTTNAPLQDDDDDDAVTIVPIKSNPSETLPSSTTEIADMAGVEFITTTTAQSQPSNIAGQELQVDSVTTISSASVGVQEVEITTRQSPVAVAGSQETGIETTTVVDKLQQQVTTLLPESEESDESEEETRVTPGAAEEADIQKTTLPPANNDFTVSTTTGPMPVSDNSPPGEETSQEDEVLPGTTSASIQHPSENEVITPGAAAVQQDSNNSNDGSSGIMYPTGFETTVPPMQYLPSSPSVDMENEKIVLEPGSEAANENNEISSPSDGASAAEQGENVTGEPITETVRPFPTSSPASTGEAGGSEQQQLFPGGEPSAAPSETTPSAAIHDQQVSFPGGEPEQFFPESESSTISPPFSDSQQSTGSEGGEQSIPVSESSTSSDSSQAANLGDAARLPTTSSPVGGDDEPDSVSESGSSNEGEPSNANGGEQSHGTGSSSDSSTVSSTGNESIGSTFAPSGISGSESLHSGPEPSSQGSESIASGTESSNSGNEPSTSGSSSQSDHSDSPGGESLVSESASVTEEFANGVSSSSQSPVSSNEGEEPSTVSADENKSESMEPVTPEQQQEYAPTIPPQDDPAPSDDSEPSNNELVVPSTAVPSTSAGGSTETENISQDPVPSVPSDTPENASTLPGSSSQQTDSPAPADNLQDSQPGSPSSQAPSNVSSPASVGSSFDMTTLQPSTAAPANQEASPEQPNYQILKACKFQTFFRSVNDMTYSFRHYPWLATIVGGTRPFSSGTLITDRHILTASHFLANITVSDVFNMRIHIGYRTSYSGQTEGPYAVRKVRKVIRHKGFSFEKLYNDIAVLVLDRPVRFSEDIYPVCISSNRTAYADGTAEAFETGWVEDPRAYTISHHHNYVDPHIQKYFSFGYKNITWRLQEAPQRVRTNQECQSNYNFLEKNGIMVTDSMVCAGSGDTRSCAFRGNSGAPLFLRNENDRLTEQIGIVSFGIGCGHFPFVFTRVESFLPWLDRVVYNSR